MTRVALRCVDTVAADEVSERLELGWWWVTESNPPCVSWCDRIHAFDEFASSGVLLCSRAVAIAPDFTVSVDQAQMAVEGSPGAINQNVSVLVQAEDVELDRVGALTGALRSAQLLGRGACA